MTRRTFYRKLRKVAKKFTWTTDEFTTESFIRGKMEDGFEVCPITAVLYGTKGLFERPGQFLAAANKLGLDMDDAKMIAYSADREEYKPIVNRAIRRAVGLLPSVG